MAVKILIGVVVVLGGFLAYVAMRPSEMHISREILVNAAPEAVFPYINSSKRSNEWMPWQGVIQK